MEMRGREDRWRWRLGMEMEAEVEKSEGGRESGERTIISLFSPYLQEDTISCRKTDFQGARRPWTKQRLRLVGQTSESRRDCLLVLSELVSLFVWYL